MQVRFLIQHQLLLQEDQDDRLIPDSILFRIHCNLLLRLGHHVWGFRLSGIFHLCQEDLQEHQM